MEGFTDLTDSRGGDLVFTYWWGSGNVSVKVHVGGRYCYEMAFEVQSATGMQSHFPHMDNQFKPELFSEQSIFSH